MIRFCDKEVFVISEEMAEQVSRSDLLHFFIQNDTMQIIMIVDDENHVQGTIAYDRVLRYHEKKEYILEKTFKISEGFWTEAKLFFEQHPSALVPVVNDWGGTGVLLPGQRRRRQAVGSIGTAGKTYGRFFIYSGIIS